MKFSKSHIENLKKAQRKRWSNIKARKKQSQTLKQQRQKESFSKKQRKYTPKKLSIYTIEYLQTTYPFFCRLEKMRYNEKYEIEFICKQCEKWFVPKKSDIKSRINALEREDGNDGCYLYCSKECKNICPVYQLRNYNIINEKLNVQEYQEYRKVVLERDNYICQYCGRKATHVHHIRPKKLEPFFALDPDYGLSCCDECHRQYAHKNKECTTGYLASKQC